jgi:hypothetical protein
MAQRYNPLALQRQLDALESVLNGEEESLQTLTTGGV